MQYILILAILTYGSNGGNTVAMQEFSSRDKCEDAAKTASMTLKPYSSVSTQVVCVPK